ncbi:membrane progestin receptor gamma-B-like [Lytechinus pictus]|uniref:membrane progestin receptor gamma-B-like n=1 Tax=Lytechinus pictus TaxID=7653 RepID=UPI0030BA1C00
MWTIKLLRFNQVPSDFHEPFIISGYRSCRSSVASCLVSAIQGSNETINFWTHFIPAMWFGWTTLRQVTDGTVIGDPFSWPLICFLLSSFLYLIASSMAHLFNCISLPARYVTFFFDYGAISIYSFGCSIAYYAYVFPPELLLTVFHQVYLVVAMCAAVMCTFLACYSRFSSNHFMYHSGRLPAFMIPYIWCSLPLFYRLLFCTEPNPDSNAALFHVRHILGAVATAFVYASRFPEVLAPGTFDFIGQSHQLFHIGGVFATYTQYRAFSLDMSERRQFLVEAVGLPTVGNTQRAFLVVLTLNLLIIWAYSHWVSQPKSLDMVRQRLEKEKKGRGCSCD